MNTPRTYASIILTWCVFGLGASSLLLYTIGRSDLTEWTGHARMASPTALGFVLISFVLMIQRRRQFDIMDEIERLKRERLLP